LAEWVKVGWFLDFGSIPEDVRPFPANEKKYRFGYVTARRLTEIEDIYVPLQAVTTGTVTTYQGLVDFGASPLKDILQPSEGVCYQCAYGIYPDVKTYLEHPVDYQQGKLVKETPDKFWRVGIVKQFDSPYEDPNLDATEFWVFAASGYHSPKIHILSDFPATVYIRVLVNVLVVEPVRDAEVIRQLERRIKPSYPVTVKYIRA